MKFFAVGLIGVGTLTAAVLGSLSAITSNAPITRYSATSTTQSPSISTGPHSVESVPVDTSQETCGDPSDSTATWYAVFVYGGNLDEVRTKYCKDAISTNRQDSGKASIQVASFSDRGRAEAFARTVNGEVSQYDPNAEIASDVVEPRLSRLQKTFSINESDSLLAKAMKYYGQEDYAKSLELFQQILESDPTNPRAWMNIGEVHHKLGDDYSAKLAMDKSREMHLEIGDQNGADQVDRLLESWNDQNNVTNPSGSGRCNSPNDVDIRGHRCGGRAKGMRH